MKEIKLCRFITGETVIGKVTEVTDAHVEIENPFSVVVNFPEKEGDEPKVTFMPMEVLSELIVDKIDNKEWLSNERANSEHKKLLAKTVRKEFALRHDGFPIKVEKCPEKMREWNGKYAKRAGINDCLYCKYCLAVGPETRIVNRIRYIHCIGHIQDVFDEYIGDTACYENRIGLLDKDMQ